MKITVITACYNAANDLEATIKSVLMQTYKDVEYIIVDGLSNDGTADILSRYKDFASLIIREKDNGVFEAMNKGVRAATGELLFFLNAGDVFYNEFVLEHIAKRYSIVDADIIFGDVVLFNPATGYNFFKDHTMVDKRYFYFNTLCHQGVFVKKSLFDRFGCFVENYKIAGDYEWFLRTIFRNGARLHQTDLIISVFKFGGISSRPELDALHRQERKEVQKQYFSRFETLFFENSVTDKNLAGRLLNISLYKLIRKIFRWDIHRVDVPNWYVDLK